MWEGKGDAMGVGGRSHDGDGHVEFLGESPKAIECDLWAGDCGLVPKPTLRAVGGVLKGDPSK